MTDSCGTCFFYISGFCHFAAPEAMSGPKESSFIWPKVKTTDWCGAGVDRTTKACFGTGITGMPLFAGTLE